MSTHYLIADCHFGHNNITILGVEQRCGLWLSHVPIPDYELYRGNSIHGHILNSEGEVDDRYFCVSCEQVNYRPISLNDIKEKRNWL